MRPDWLRFTAFGAAALVCVFVSARTASACTSLNEEAARLAEETVFDHFTSAGRERVLAGIGRTHERVEAVDCGDYIRLKYNVIMDGELAIVGGPWYFWIVGEELVGFHQFD